MLSISSAERVWMYQLNPNKGNRFVWKHRGKRREDRTTAAGLASILEDEGPVLDLSPVSKNFKEAEPGDPVIVRVNGGRVGEATGLVAFGWIERTGSHEVHVRFDRAATRRLMASPVPLDDVRRVIPTDRLNLGEVTKYRRQIEEWINGRDESTPLWWLYALNWKGNVHDIKSAVRRVAKEGVDWEDGRVLRAKNGRWPQRGDRLALYATPKWLGDDGGVFATLIIDECATTGGGEKAKKISALRAHLMTGQSKRLAKQPIPTDVVNPMLSRRHSGGKPGWGQKANLWPMDGVIEEEFLRLVEDAPPITKPESLRFQPPLDLGELDEEGRRGLRRHFQVERSAKNRDRVLNSRPKPLRCDACGIVPSDMFGPALASLVEVHHAVPVTSGVRTPKPEEFDVLCPTCHRAAHYKRGDKPLRATDLKATLRRQSSARGPGRASGERRRGLGPSSRAPEGRRLDLPSGLSILRANGISKSSTPDDEAGSGAGHVDVGLLLSNEAGQDAFVFPAGFVMVAKRRDFQHGLLVQEVRIELPPKSQKLVRLHMYCANQHRHPADESVEFTVGPVVEDEDLRQLFALVGGSPIPADKTHVVQRAVWEITDGDGIKSETLSELSESLA